MLQHEVLVLASPTHCHSQEGVVMCKQMHAQSQQGGVLFCITGAACSGKTQPYNPETYCTRQCVLQGHSQ